MAEKKIMAKQTMPFNFASQSFGYYFYQNNQPAFSKKTGHHYGLDARKLPGQEEIQCNHLSLCHRTTVTTNRATLFQAAKCCLSNPRPTKRSENTTLLVVAGLHPPQTQQPNFGKQNAISQRQAVKRSEVKPLQTYTQVHSHHKSGH